MSLEEDFRHAVEHMKRFKSPVAPGLKLVLYGLFKQARLGDCTLKKPKRNTKADDLQVMKWEAWKQNKGLSKSDAKKKYIENALTIDSSMAQRASKCKSCHATDGDALLEALPQVSSSERTLVKGLGPKLKAKAPPPIPTYINAKRRPSRQRPISSTNKSPVLRRRVSDLSGANPLTEAQDDSARLLLYERLRVFYSNIDMERLSEGIGDLVDWTMKNGEDELNKELMNKYGENLKTLEAELKKEEEKERKKKVSKIGERRKKLNTLRATMSPQQRHEIEKLYKFLLLYDPVLADAGMLVILQYIEAKGMHQVNRDLQRNYGQDLNSLTDEELAELLVAKYGEDFDPMNLQQSMVKSLNAAVQTNHKEKERKPPQTLSVTDSEFFEDNLREFLKVYDPDRAEKAFPVMKKYASANGVQALNMKLTERYGENLATFSSKSKNELQVELHELRFRLLQYVKFHEPERVEAAYESMVSYMEKHGRKALDEQLYKKYGAYAFKENTTSIVDKSLRELHNEDLPPNTLEMLEYFYIKYDAQVVLNGGVERVFGWAERNGYDALNLKLKQKYQESLEEFIASREELRKRLTRFYATVDPGKSPIKIEKIVTWAMKNGMVALNRSLRKRYGADLEATPKTLPVKF